MSQPGIKADGRGFSKRLCDAFVVLLRVYQC